MSAFRFFCSISALYGVYGVAIKAIETIDKTLCNSSKEIFEFNQLLNTYCEQSQLGGQVDVGYSTMLSYRWQWDEWTLVENHKLDCRNDVDPLVVVYQDRWLCNEQYD